MMLKKIKKFVLLLLVILVIVVLFVTSYVLWIQPIDSHTSVSYTHLDVYKRQVFYLYLFYLVGGK
ncbi:hypothetical protein A5875_004169 [Enterococcus sp. 3H8_DIV0648]|nr:hypothetical protein A5875_004169 [Enterococcus sp. 3H8_DIV0648]